MASTSLALARRITAVILTDGTQARRAGPADADLHADGRRGRDEPWRRLAGDQARLPHPGVRGGRRAQLADLRRAGRGPAGGRAPDGRAGPWRATRPRRR